MSKTITISDETWEKIKDQVSETKFELYDKYVVIRTHSAGVFAGILAERDGKEVKLQKARRLWYWEGAFTLSEIATSGVSKPNDCKFACELEEIILTEVIEIIPCSNVAQESIRKVKNYVA
jgi:Mg2+ and Co2+ transporter CorA